MSKLYIAVLTTTPSQKIAQKISAILLKQKLAACVQIIGPIESHYWWRGKIEKAKEWLCIIKSSKAKFAKIEKTVKALHPYSVPEIVTLPITAGSREYLAWLANY